MVITLDTQKRKGSRNSALFLTLHAWVLSRVAAAIIVSLSALFLLAGIIALMSPGQSVGISVEMLALCFIFILFTGGPAFGSVRVTKTGVTFPGWLYLRRHFLARDQIASVEVFPVRAMGRTDNGIFLVSKDGKRHRISILTSYDTAKGRAWIQHTRNLMANSLSLP